MKIILASASPRRKELLSQAGYNFAVCPAQGEEVIRKTVPSEVVEELSEQKAMWTAHKVMREEAPQEPCVIIGADTVVAIEHRILGKPADEQEAYQMISLLQGKVHQVYTGVTLVLTEGSKIVRTRTFHECTDVDVYEMTENEIKDYIATPEPYDKAGAYGIQGSFGVYIRGIRGCYYNVVGFPIARFRHELNRFL